MYDIVIRIVSNTQFYKIEEKGKINKLNSTTTKITSLTVTSHRVPKPKAWTGIHATIVVQAHFVGT